MKTVENGKDKSLNITVLVEPGDSYPEQVEHSINELKEILETGLSQLNDLTRKNRLTLVEDSQKLKRKGKNTSF